jgi:hypothetical protein
MVGQPIVENGGVQIGEWYFGWVWQKRSNTATLYKMRGRLDCTDFQVMGKWHFKHSLPPY